jgi:mannosyl-oligosaccharide alpha-1,2-mannosidase
VCVCVCVHVMVCNFSETVESLYVLYRLTGDEQYREWGLTIFNAIEKHCRTPNGYVGLRDIRDPNSKLNKQESYFLAETLK